MRYAHSQVNEPWTKKYFIPAGSDRKRVSDKEQSTRTAVVVQSVTRKPFAENEDAVSSTIGC
jgi:hypothetical protein